MKGPSQPAGLPGRSEPTSVDGKTPPSFPNDQAESKQSAFDSNQWNSSIGLGGGGGGRFGGRGGVAGVESYAATTPNTFTAVTALPLSTFAADVDTASFANVRRLLREGSLPPVAAVRVEEFVNAQDYRLPVPAANEPFAIVTELSACPWQPAHRLLRIAMRTRPIDAARVPPCNLVFLIDTSGSMRSADKLPLVQRALALLVEQLRPQDRVAIVTYAGKPSLALPSTPGSERERILEVLAGLESSGGTNGAGGIKSAYEIAVANLIREGTNRVLLCTDGDFNVGISSPEELAAFITTQRDQGVFLTTLGVGRGNLKDDRLERLANEGNGVYAYLDDLQEARRVMVEQFGASLATVAKDVKLQVEFDPAQVAGYRQIGYENRQLTAAEFRDDKKDAGELGAGHAMTVLYEIVPRGVPVPGLDEGAVPVPAVADGAPLATLRIRHKPPLGDTAKEQSLSIAAEVTVAPSRDQRLAIATAAFGQLLAGSAHLGRFDWTEMDGLIDEGLEAATLQQMVAAAHRLVGATAR
ncbi:MAG: VWA domain-containing protein [Planctomycetes bacterium]|nr:VWA domain-containing protein [Planctomycetota bacterium]